jgi:hypothetical protein
MTPCLYNRVQWCPLQFRIAAVGALHGERGAPYNSELPLQALYMEKVDPVLELLLMDVRESWRCELFIIPLFGLANFFCLSDLLQNKIYHHQNVSYIEVIKV